jgi:hypothetical protein
LSVPGCPTAIVVGFWSPDGDRCRFLVVLAVVVGAFSLPWRPESDNDEGVSRPAQRIPRSGKGSQMSRR